MRFAGILHSVILFGGLSASSAAYCLPATYTYTYRIEHPVYGDIGTYTHVISENADLTTINSKLNVAVRIFGAVIYRETADQNEILRGEKLISFQSVIERNGHRFVVGGEETGNGFQITSPAGVTFAPDDVVPSNPWSLTQLGRGTVVSIASGKVDSVEVIGGEKEMVMINGGPVATRHFLVRTELQPDKWQVWFDEHGVPVKFRSNADNTRLDFSLSSPAQERVAGEKTPQ